MVYRPFHAVLVNFRRMGAKILCNKKFCSVLARFLGKLKQIKCWPVYRLIVYFIDHLKIWRFKNSDI